MKAFVGVGVEVGKGFQSEHAVQGCGWHRVPLQPKKAHSESNLYPRFRAAANCRISSSQNRVTLNSNKQWTRKWNIWIIHHPLPWGTSSGFPIDRSQRAILFSLRRGNYQWGRGLQVLKAKPSSPRPCSRVNDFLLRFPAPFAFHYWQCTFANEPRIVPFQWDTNKDVFVENVYELHLTEPIKRSFNQCLTVYATNTV